MWERLGISRIHGWSSGFQAMACTNKNICVAVDLIWSNFDEQRERKNG